MDRNRRSFLQGLVTVGATAVAGPALARSENKPGVPDDALGMLYDSTRCIGCKACVVACHESNGLPPDNRENDLHDMPRTLNERTKNIIRLYRDGDRRSYVKRQCMHCLDPACVGACMIGALKKREHGIVTWDTNKCIGCRYCQVACPYEVPKFEWESKNPRIIKCELCNHRFADGKGPACCEVCPREAVVFGKYEDLLADAKQRLTDHPGRYVDRIYGETDGGGTQVLYLSHVEFDKLGLPELGDDSHAKLNRDVQHGVYQGMIAPAALYVALGGVMLRNRVKNKGDKGGAS